MRRLPKFIRVLGLKVALGQDWGLSYEDGGHSHSAWGLYDGDAPRVWLAKEAGVERVKATLVHEALHAMLSIAHIDEVDGEEELVTRLAPILHDFIRSNRGAIAYLQES